MRLFLRWCALCGLVAFWIVAWWLGGVLIEVFLRR